MGAAARAASLALGIALPAVLRSRHAEVRPYSSRSFRNLAAKSFPFRIGMGLGRLLVRCFVLLFSLYAVAVAEPLDEPIFSSKFRAFDAGPYPRQVQLADLNGDGHLDVLVGNFGPVGLSSNAGVSILLGRGDGTLEPRIHFDQDHQMRVLRLAELNTDEHLDLVGISATTGEVLLWLGGGDGSFSRVAALQAGIEPRYLAVADVTGDRRNDLVVVNSVSLPITIFRNTGNTSFTALPGPPTVVGPIAIDDINGDSIPDLVVIDTSSNAVQLLSGSGNGDFEPLTGLKVGGPPNNVAIADLNADGQSDLVVACHNNLVSVLLSGGGGEFEAHRDYATASAPRDVEIVDLNDDDAPDLAVVCEEDERVSVWLGSGDGSFAARTDYAAGAGPRELAVGDMDSRDGPDLVVTNFPSHAVAVLLNEGDGTFGRTADFRVGGGPCWLATGDLNGDDRTDVVSANRAARTLVVLAATRDGGWREAATLRLDAPPSYVAIGDVNGDARPDLVAVSESSNDTWVFLNHGDARFTASSTLAPPQVGKSPLAGNSFVIIDDLNMDGTPDVLVTNREWEMVSIFYGPDNGEFSRHALKTGDHTSPGCAAVVDLNGDKRPDLVLGNVYSSTVTVALSREDSGFVVVGHDKAAHYVRSLLAGDFDADGKQDLVAVGDHYEIRVLHGNGDGTFGKHSIYEMGMRPSSASVADLNGDSRLDLAVANWGSNTVSVLFGMSNGDFGNRRDFGTTSGPACVIIDDLNADTFPDLLVAAERDDTLSILSARRVR